MSSDNPSLTRDVAFLALLESLSEHVIMHPDWLGGTPIFRGTRVPVKSLFDYLRAGDSLDEFLRQFPGVKQSDCLAVMTLAGWPLPASARHDDQKGNIKPGQAA